MPDAINSAVTVVAILVPLSLAAERVVEIIKGIVPFLNQQKTDPKQEGWRHAALQALAVVAGVGVALLAGPALVKAVPLEWQTPQGVLGLGLLASGGSGFWNAMLGYVLRIKDLKKQEVEEVKDRKQAIVAGRATLARIRL